MDAVVLKLVAGRTACGAAVEGDPGLRRTQQVRLQTSRGNLEHLFQGQITSGSMSQGGFVEVLVTKVAF